MLAELYREAMERAGMQTLQEALHHELGAEVEPLYLLRDGGLEIFFNGHEACLPPVSGAAMLLLFVRMGQHAIGRRPRMGIFLQLHALRFASRRL